MKQDRFSFANRGSRNRTPESEQVWSTIILADPEKYGGKTGLMYRLALMHLHRIGKPHPGDCPLCLQERQEFVA